MDLATAILLTTLSVTGPARVIDGDTVVVNQTHVRLKGVDAAERNTPLGKIATQVMREIVHNQPLTCRLTGEKTHKRDVGYCFTPSGVDINQEIIARGAALSCVHYDPRYAPYETAKAKAEQKRAGYCGTPKPVSKQTGLPLLPGYDYAPGPRFEPVKLKSAAELSSSAKAPEATKTKTETSGMPTWALWLMWITLALLFIRFPFPCFIILGLILSLGRGGDSRRSSGGGYW